jgi:hypothetical protein
VPLSGVETAGAAVSPSIMAVTSAWTEVEAILHGCRDLCLRTIGAGVPPAPACAFLEAWQAHMDTLTWACERLPKEPAFGPVRSWVAFQEVRTILSGASAWPAELRGALLVCWAAVGRAVAPRAVTDRIPAVPRGDHHDDAPPAAQRPPDRTFLRQWTDGAVPRHAFAGGGLGGHQTGHDGGGRAPTI